MFGKLRILSLSLLVLPGASQAGSISIVNEAFLDGNTLSGVACYNGGGSVGPFGVNCNPPGFVGSGGSITGTMDTVGAATSAFENLVLTSPDGTSASAYSAGDLSSGTVHSLSAGSLPLPPSGGEGIANITLKDNVHFVVTGAGAADITPITVKFELDGMLSAPAANSPLASVFSNLTLGGSVSANFQVLNGVAGAGSLNGQSGWASFSYASDTANSVIFSGVFDLVGPTTTLPFSISLNTVGADGGMADYSNTARVSLILPSNVTYTSDSGAFLTAAAVAAPEPALWPVAGLGLGLGLFFRRVKRA